MPLSTSNKTKLREKRNNEKNHTKSNRYQRLKNNAELTIQGKKKAHQIVLSFLEPGVTEQEFGEKIPYITPEHYEDIVVERAIAELCGYPLCDSKFLEQKLQQTYTIRNNKVYDITHRRNFCSDVCYEASELIQKQIPTTPLYLRKNDLEIQNLKIYIPNKTSLKGRIGKIVNITGTLCDEDINNSSAKNQRSKPSPTDSQSSKGNTSSDSVSFTNNESSMSDEISSSSKISNSSSWFGLSPCEYVNESETTFSTVSPDSENFLSNKTESLNLNDSKEVPYEQKNCFSNDDNQRENISSSGTGKLSENTEKLTSNKKHLEDIYEIEQTLREWMNFEALRIILGDVYVRGMLEELGKSWEDYDTTSGLRLGVESKSKYIALCKKLDKEEMRETIFESSDKEMKLEEDQETCARKQMPDYEQLKKSVEQSSFKVRSFYEGSEEFINYKDELETIQEENEGEESSTTKKKNKRKSMTKNKGNSDSEMDSVSLPLIDTYSQNTWRRQIVFEKLSKSLADFVNEFGLDEVQVRRLAISLIATFDLTSQNISLKSSQWKLVALVILKMLSVRYPIIYNAFIPGGLSFEIVTSFLNHEGLDPDYLNRLLTYLTEIKFILTKYHRNEIDHYPNVDPERCQNSETSPRNDDFKSSSGGAEYSEIGCPSNHVNISSNDAKDSEGDNQSSHFIDRSYTDSSIECSYTDYQQLD